MLQSSIFNLGSVPDFRQPTNERRGILAEGWLRFNELWRKEKAMAYMLKALYFAKVFLSSAQPQWYEMRCVITGSCRFIHIHPKIDNFNSRQKTGCEFTKTRFSWVWSNSCVVSSDSYSVQDFEKLEMLGSIVSRLAHYDACVNLSTLCKRGIFWQGTC